MNRKILLFALIELFLYVGWAFLTKSEITSGINQEQETKNEYIMVPIPTDTTLTDTVRN